MITEEQIRGALMRAYCTEMNIRKEMDANLISAIIIELMNLIEADHAAREAKPLVSPMSAQKHRDKDDK